MDGNDDYRYYRSLFDRTKERDAALFIFAELVNSVSTHGIWADNERLGLLKTINRAYRDAIAS